MGCASSKKIGATSPSIYRPPPSSFAVFDINAIEEPWLKLDTVVQTIENHNQQPKPSHVPTPLLEKLETLEKEVSNGPRTWDEVSKALEDLNKPTASPKPSLAEPPKPPAKASSLHTVEDLESNNNNNRVNNERVTRLRKTESIQAESEVPFPIPNPDGVTGSVKVNPFILRDRLEREKEGKEAAFDRIMKSKRDPLSDFPEKCPSSGSHLVVLYTTSLGGVRRTYEDCNRVRTILETHRVVFDERDVSLHGEFLTELRDLVGVNGPAVVPVPKLFVKGRYLGGVEEVVELNETGRLGRIMSWARVERGIGWQGCEGCGGVRFVPCLECGGSCKVMVEDDKKERCPNCNENGLIQCPLCH